MATRHPAVMAAPHHLPPLPHTAPPGGTRELVDEPPPGASSSRVVPARPVHPNPHPQQHRWRQWTAPNDYDPSDFHVSGSETWRIPRYDSTQDKHCRGFFQGRRVAPQTESPRDLLAEFIQQRKGEQRENAAVLQRDAEVLRSALKNSPRQLEPPKALPDADIAPDAEGDYAAIGERGVAPPSALDSFLEQQRQMPMVLLREFGSRLQKQQAAIAAAQEQIRVRKEELRIKRERSQADRLRMSAPAYLPSDAVAQVTDMAAIMERIDSNLTSNMSRKSSSLSPRQPSMRRSDITQQLHKNDEPAARSRIAQQETEERDNVESSIRQLRAQHLADKALERAVTRWAARSREMKEMASHDLLGQWWSQQKAFFEEWKLHAFVIKEQCKAMTTSAPLALPNLELLRRTARDSALPDLNRVFAAEQVSQPAICDDVCSAHDGFESLEFVSKALAEVDWEQFPYLQLVLTVSGVDQTHGAKTDAQAKLAPAPNFVASAPLHLPKPAILEEVEDQDAEEVEEF